MAFDLKEFENEFNKAFASMPFHYAPEGYWDAIHAKRKKHPYVGRKAKVLGKIRECTEAEYGKYKRNDIVIFSNGEIIISGDDVDSIQWID